MRVTVSDFSNHVSLSITIKQIQNNRFTVTRDVFKEHHNSLIWARKQQQHSNALATAQQSAMSHLEQLSNALTTT